MHLRNALDVLRVFRLAKVLKMPERQVGTTKELAVSHLIYEKPKIHFRDEVLSKSHFPSISCLRLKVNGLLNSVSSAKYEEKVEFGYRKNKNQFQ